jgi:hypothetical protein
VKTNTVVVDVVLIIVTEAARARGTRSCVQHDAYERAENVYKKNCKREHFAPCDGVSETLTMGFKWGFERWYGSAACVCICDLDQLRA